jgi:hypothetical protein
MERLIINTQKNILYNISDVHLEKCAQLKITRNDFNKILQYISRPDAIQILLDRTKCILCNTHVSHFETLFTNRIWIWSADLNHYFEKHFFQFPDEFYKYAQLVNYQMPPLSVDVCQELYIEYFDNPQSLDLLEKQSL